MGILENLDKAISLIDELNTDAEKRIAKNTAKKVPADKEEDFFVCCICDEVSNGFGNNPETVGALKYSLDAKCCDECNDTVVVPARISAMFG
jgi:hypothetical protein